MNKSASRNSLFFIELIISIFFFILVATVCLQLFAKSHELSKRSLESNHAIQWCQNIAEIFLGNDGDFSLVKMFYASTDVSADYISQTEAAANTLLLFINQDWEICTSSTEACYFLLAKGTQDTTFSYETIYIYPVLADFDETIALLADSFPLNDTGREGLPDTLIQSLQVKKHTPNTLY